MLSVLADSPGHLAVMAALLCCSAFFSGSETALFNLSQEQLRRFRASASPLRRSAARLMDDPRRLLVTVLFGNMTVNTAFFVMGVVLIHQIADRHPQHLATWRFIIGTATPVAVIVFGEIMPKSVAAAMPERLAPFAGPPLAVLEHVVMPVRAVLGRAFVAPLTRLITGGRHEPQSFLTTDELRAIIDMAQREGAVSPDESDMLADVIELGELRVRDVMVPRVEIIGCSIATPTRVVLVIFRQSKSTKIIVYEGEMDNVVGVVYAKTAFLNPDKPLADLVRPVYFVPESKTVESLLKDFRARRIQFAVVVDEYGGLAGLVTLEDCLEQIVGSIEDETDRPSEPPVQSISDTEYLLAGDLSVRSWADAFDLEVPEGGRFSTLAGFVTTLLGRVPARGDVVRWRNVEFAVEEVRRRRVTRVRLRLKEEPPGGAAHPAGRAR